MTLFKFGWKIVTKKLVNEFLNVLECPQFFPITVNFICPIFETNQSIPSNGLCPFYLAFPYFFKLATWQHRKIAFKVLVLIKYIDGSCSVDHKSCSLVSPVNRQRQSDGYQWCLFQCCSDIVKMKETSNK